MPKTMKIAVEERIIADQDKHWRSGVEWADRQREPGEDGLYAMDHHAAVQGSGDLMHKVMRDHGSAHRP